MKNIEDINKANVKKISAEKKLPEFFPGDIIKVGVKITEGKRDSCLLYTSPSPRD